MLAEIAPGDIIDTGKDSDEDDEVGPVERAGQIHKVIVPKPAKLLLKVPTPTVATQDIFHLSEGPAILQVPNALSEASYQDLEEWLMIALRKIKRSVRSEHPAEDNVITES